MRLIFVIKINDETVEFLFKDRSEVTSVGGRFFMKLYSMAGPYGDFILGDV